MSSLQWTLIEKLSSFAVKTFARVKNVVYGRDVANKQMSGLVEIMFNWRHVMATAEHVD